MEWPSSCSFVETRARIIAFVVLRCLARLVRLDLGQLRRDATLGFQSVIGILQPQEIAFRQAEELAETQIGITCDGAGPIDDGVDAIARNANRMRELVLAHADWVKELLLKNLAGMGIRSCAMFTSIVFYCGHE